MDMTVENLDYVSKLPEGTEKPDYVDYSTYAKYRDLLYLER